MEANKSISLTPTQVSVLIDAVHERFMAVSSGRERLHEDAERTKLLDTLSNLHARLQEMEDEDEDEDLGCGEDCCGMSCICRAR